MGARLLGLSIRNGVATVNLSRESWPRAAAPWPPAARRLAQVVFTVSRFPTVRSVRLQIEGRPVAAPGTRAAYERLAPPVLVESPAFNDPYRTPMRVEGTATGSFTLEVVDRDGRVVVTTFVRLREGARSAFDVTVRFTMGLSPRGGLLASTRGARGRRIPLLDMPLGLAR